MLYEADWTPGVVKLVPQPCKLDIWVDGIKREYTPDLLIVFSDGEMEYREAKSESPDDDPEMAARLDAASKEFARRGHRFTVVTAEQLRRGHRLTNLRALHRYAAMPVPDTLRNELRRRLPLGSRVAFGDLVSDFDAAALAGTYALLRRQELGADLDLQALGLATPIWRNFE